MYKWTSFTKNVSQCTDMKFTLTNTIKSTIQQKRLVLNLSVLVNLLSLVPLHKSLIQFICKQFTHLHIWIHKDNYIFHGFDNIVEYLEKYRCQYGLFRNGISIMTWLKLNSIHFDRLFTTLIRQTGISRSRQPRRMLVEREPLPSFMSQHNGCLLWIG